ncbi:MAG: alpha/beta hydrolase [Gammaproteobacteria bacterium]|nr:alpha/beta hydrolase [Gammaproteobacteria bacterium]MCK5092307.1 alpha/beta hydrolase [Gammaproteobacteria bacterium]
MDGKHKSIGSNLALSNGLPCSGKPFTIPGPCGNLEVLVSCPEESQPNQVVVISHPHPLHGGTMQNKVVHTIAKTVNQVGLKAVRYNFRGVGASEGDYAEGVGEADDLVAIVDWVRSQIPDCAIWLAGFSFGGYVSLRAADKVDAERLITVAPAISFLEEKNISMPGCPWLLIQGMQDEVVPASSVIEWCGTLSRPPEIITIEDTGHFFHGQLNVLRDTLIQYLSEE